jgi:hypothetical protein
LYGGGKRLLQSFEFRLQQLRLPLEKERPIGFTIPSLSQQSGTFTAMQGLQLMQCLGDSVSQFCNSRPQRVGSTKCAGSRGA